MGKTWRLASKIHTWLFQTHLQAWLLHSSLTCIHTNTHKHILPLQSVCGGQQAHMCMSALLHTHVYMWRPKLTLDVFFSHSLPCLLKLGPSESPAVTIHLVEQAPHKAGSPVSASQPCETCQKSQLGRLILAGFSTVTRLKALALTIRYANVGLSEPSLPLPMLCDMICGLAESYCNVWELL